MMPLANRATRAAAGLISMLALSVLGGCGQTEKPYEKKPDAKEKADIPKVPQLPPLTKKTADGWNIHGLIHDFRSQNHHTEVENAKLTIVGYIVKTNLVPCAKKDEMNGLKEQCTPACAVHPQGSNKGKGDPEGCKAPEPSFWIADTPKAEDASEKIVVVGWARNFAQIHDAIEELDKTDPEKRDKDFFDKLKDETSQIALPNPIPTVGAHVKVTGTYGAQAVRGGAMVDPNFGIMTVDTVEYIEPPPDTATLPGMKERKVWEKKDKKK